MSDSTEKSSVFINEKMMGKIALLILLIILIQPGLFPWTGTFITYIIAILLEAVPFIIIGALLSGAVSVFLPENTLPRLAEKLGHGSIPVVMGLSFVFPVCECGVVSVAKGLLRKGLPLHCTIVFLLAAPILNPIVLISTVVAFQFDYRFAAARFIGAVFVSVPVALFMSRIKEGEVFTEEFVSQTGSASCCSADRTLPLRYRLRSLFSHARDELLDMIPYLMMGVALAAAMQTFFGTRLLAEFGRNQAAGTASMMSTAFTLSLCSEADAFVGKTFYGPFNFTSVMAFLVLGPMLDIKLLLMYRTVFRKKFITLFALSIIAGVVIYSILLGVLFS